MSSLQQLENRNWGDPDAASTALTKRCIQLTKIPIADFAIEDLRIMIGQGFGLTYLIPLAIEKLKENILVEGDLYPGDLLSSILKIDKRFWGENKQLLSDLKTIIKDNEGEIAGANISLESFNITH
jgi:hypothetical protein